MSNLHNHFIYEEIRQLERERPNPARLHRQRWRAEEALRSRRTRRTAAAWLGVRLIALGLQLNAGAAPVTRTYPHPGSPRRRPA